MPFLLQVVERAEKLFSEVCKAIKQVAGKKYDGHAAGIKFIESKLAVLEGLLRNEKTGFEVMFG